MKVLKIISSLNYGGAETQLIRSSKELVRKGHEVCVYVIASNSEREKELALSGVELVVDNKKWKIDLSVIKRIRKKIQSFQPDIVHAYLFDAEFYSRVAMMGLKVPLINSERSDDYLLNNSQKIGNCITGFRINGVIANTYAGKQHTLSIHKKLNENNSHVVWNSVDIPLAEEKARNSAANYKHMFFGDAGVRLAIMVASVKKPKNYEFALRVANALVERNVNWNVIFVGDKVSNTSAEYSKEIRLLYEETCNPEKIKFLGNRDDVVELMAASNVSFLTSHYEGFPNVVLESMVVGTPVVTTFFSDIKKILPLDWMIVREEDPDLFSDTIVRADKNAAELSVLSKKWVNKNCSIDVITDELISVYQKYV